MTEPTPNDPQHPPPDIDLAVLPAHILMNFIIIVLAPMLLTAAGADIAFARMAVVETIRAYQPRNQADLIAVAQIVACGLAALGSLSLSMADDLPLSMVLRLRGNANALNRSAEQNRRTRLDSRSATDQPAETQVEPADAQYEAEVLTSVAETERRFADARATAPAAEPAPPPAPIALPQAPVAEPTERQHQTAWAGVMINAAKRFTASLSDLPPQERNTALMRAAALSKCANDLLSGDDAPRLRPGALRAMIQADTA
jgi:hypothetical protein